MSKKYILTNDVVMVNLAEDRTYTLKRGEILKLVKEKTILGTKLLETEEGEKMYVFKKDLKPLSSSIKKI